MFLIRLLVGIAMAQSLPPQMSPGDDATTREAKDRAQIAFALNMCDKHISRKRDNGDNLYEQPYQDCYYIEMRAKLLGLR